MCTCSGTQVGVAEPSQLTLAALCACTTGRPDAVQVPFKAGSVSNQLYGSNHTALPDSSTG